MNANQEITSLQIAAQDAEVKQETPTLVEQFSIDELAVREEYAACLTIK